MWGEHDHTILRKRSQLGPLFIERWDAGIIVPHPQAMNPSTDPKTLEICSTEYRGSRCCARTEEVILRNDTRCVPLVTEWVRRARIGKVTQEVEPRTDGWDNPVDGGTTCPAKDEEGGGDTEHNNGESETLPFSVEV